MNERIQKARAAFFANGQLGAFHGFLNPLSSRSIVECCILPVLLYGSETWVLIILYYKYWTLFKLN